MPKLKPKSKKSKKGKKQPDAPILTLKEQLAQKRQAQKQRKEFIQLATITGFSGAILGLLLGLMIDFKIGVIVGAAIPCLALSYKYPYKALWVFLIYMPFSGTVTYALGGNALLQLAKDGFYIPAAIAIFQECQRKKQPFIVPKALQIPLAILLALCLLTLLVVNGAQQLKPEGEKPLLLGLLGLKVFMGYIPLIFCTYRLIRSNKELLFATRLHTILAIICCALCFTQYMMLETGVCEGTRNAEGADLFKASLDARCLVGGALTYSPSQGQIRLPGTFVAPWQWGWFLIGNAFLTFATAFNDPKTLWRTGGLLGMAAVFVCAVISGQRIALALVPVITVILLVLTGQITNLKRFIPIGVGLGVVLGVAANMYPEVVQERVDSFYSRWEASPADDFILHQFEFTWKNLKGSMIGLGLGRATNSARIFGDTALIETWFPKVMHEVGPIGLIAFLAVVTTLSVVTFKAYRSVRDKNLRGIGASFWVFVLFISYQTYYYPLDVDPVAVYYWFFAGLILKLPEIDKQEREKLKLALENDPQLKKKGKIKAARKRVVATS